MALDAQAMEDKKAGVRQTSCDLRAANRMTPPLTHDAMNLSRERITELLNSRSPMRVMVVGDFILDRYCLGTVSRISPEAPIQILKVIREEDRLGGAGNVVQNLRALGAEVVPVGTMGDDPEGKRLSALLKRQGCPTGGIFIHPHHPTTVKTRMIAHAQQVLRVDRERTDPLPEKLLRGIAAHVVHRLSNVQAVLVSDYAKGTTDPSLLKGIISRAGRLDIPVLIDPKGNDYDKYKGATLLTPNQDEAGQATGIRMEEPRGIRRGAELLRRRLRLRGVAITLGKRGIAVLEGDRFEILPAQARSVYDVTGAGDTVLAAMGVAMARGSDPFAAAALGNLAAGIVVGKLGAATARPEEILQVLTSRDPQGKIQGVETLLPILHHARSQGKKIVFTNGCFDLLHSGHIRLLHEARREGDLLVVAINSDASVRRLKGDGRPILREEERAHILASLTDVDHVVLFSETTPLRIIRQIKPDVIVKGADYRNQVVVGRELVERRGGRVKLVPLVRGKSTSRIVSKLKDPQHR
jgi:D-beta-D-heptose 7-phosphate kinase/D-beta-D-heptose 1-phosphate adenosyltransferase